MTSAPVRLRLRTPAAHPLHADDTWRERQELARARRRSPTTVRQDQFLGGLFFMAVGIVMNVKAVTAPAAVGIGGLASASALSGGMTELSRRTAPGSA